MAPEGQPISDLSERSMPIGSGKISRILSPSKSDNCSPSLFSQAKKSLDGNPRLSSTAKQNAIGEGLSQPNCESSYFVSEAKSDPKESITQRQLE